MIRLCMSYVGGKVLRGNSAGFDDFPSYCQYGCRVVAKLNLALMKGDNLW